MKKAVFAILAVVVAIGLMGSAFAYFTDVESSNSNTFTAGTLNMSITDTDQANYEDTPVTASFSTGSLAPGQQFTTDPVTFNNTGSIGIPFVFGRITITSNADMAKQFKLVSYGEKSSNGSWVAASDEVKDADGYWVESFGTANAQAYLDYWGITDHTGYITMYDLWAATPLGESQKTGMWFFDNGSPANLALPSAGWAQLRFTFEFLPTATNVYQNQSVTFNMDFVGAQSADNLDNSITEY